MTIDQQPTRERRSRDSRDSKDDEIIDVLYQADGSLRSSVDLAPLTVSTHTKLARISYVLRMLGASMVLVIDEGKLAGVLTRVTLFKVERELFDQRERDEPGAGIPTGRAYPLGGSPASP